VALNPALLFDFRNQDVVADSYMFRKNSYQRESLVANRLRGVNSIDFGSRIGEDEELAAAAPAANYIQESRFHKVRRGETVYSIARKRGTSVDAILRLNHLKRSAKLKPGQILKYN
jgi:LysM repeat protein